MAHFITTDSNYSITAHFITNNFNNSIWRISSNNFIFSVSVGLVIALVVTSSSDPGAPVTGAGGADHTCMTPGCIGDQWDISYDVILVLGLGLGLDNY